MVWAAILLAVFMVPLSAADRDLRCSKRQNQVLMSELEAPAPAVSNDALKSVAVEAPAPAVSNDTMKSSAVEVTASCQVNGDSIIIPEFAPYLSSHRQNCLGLFAQKPKNSEITITIPIGKIDSKNGADYKMDLACTKGSNSWGCETKGILGMEFYIQRGAGSRHTEMVIADNDDWWCHIGSIRLGINNCEVAALKKYSGTTITQAAVKLSETLGYPIQTLGDGSEATCVGTGDIPHKLFLRTSGLLKDGLSFYMAKAGFVSYVNPTNGESGGETAIKDSLRVWCDAVSDLKKTKIEQALSNECLTGNLGFKDSQVSEDMKQQILQTCPGNPLLGECYNKVYSLDAVGDAAKKKCDMQKTLINIIDIKESWGQIGWEEQAGLIGEANARCAHKTRAVVIAQNLGMFVRFSQGFTRPRYDRPEFPHQPIFPDEVDKFCTDAPLVGWMLPNEKGCSQGTCKEFPGVEVKCASTNRCCIKQNSAVPEDYKDKTYCCNPGGGAKAALHQNKCVNGR